MNFQKIAKIVAAILGLIATFSLFGIMSQGDEAIENAYAAGESIASVDTMIPVAYVIFVLVLVSVVFFVIKNLITNAKSIKNTLVGIGAFIAILIVSFVVSGGDPTKYYDNNVLVSDGTSQLVGAGLVTFYILVVVSLAAMAWSGINKIKK